jgi:hypothetical protein
MFILIPFLVSFPPFIIFPSFMHMKMPTYYLIQGGTTVGPAEAMHPMKILVLQRNIKK